MIDLASIRNASFTLTPTGYNPEEVDRFLADLADQLAEGLTAAPVAEPVYETPQTFEAAPAPVVELPVPSREPADVDGLREVIERTIGAMDAFVANELASLKSATEVECRADHGDAAGGVGSCGHGAQAYPSSGHGGIAAKAGGVKPR